MGRAHRWLGALLVLVAVVATACAARGEGATDEESAATIEKVDGSDAVRVVLGREAAQRIGVRTDVVGGTSADASGPARVVAYAALVYDADGLTSVYTNPEPLVFVRQPVTVDHIEGAVAVLSDGPPLGTKVVTVGAEELLGVETGIGEFE